MNSRDVLRALLLAMTEGSINSVGVVWNSGSEETPISDAVPAHLDIKSVARYGRISLYWHDGFSLLLDVLGISEDDLNKGGHRYYEHNTITVVRIGDTLSVASVV